MAPRNILLLHCHDLGRFLGCYGVTTVRTPALDTFAADAALFERAFAVAPHCSPARSALFTGTYPQRNGVLGLTHSPFDWDLADPATHVGNRLRGAGYRTELIGVHHESRVLADEVVAARLGFDRVCTDTDRDTVVANAVGAIARSRDDDRPFYLQVGFHEPHRTASESDPVGVMGFLAPGVVPDDRAGTTVPPYLRDDEGARIEIAELQGAVGALDDGVARILTELDASGLADSTIVVFTTDHGLALPGAKCTLYDAGLEVALMIRVPGRPGWGGTRVSGLASHIDILPTLFELIGIPGEEFSGTSLVAAVESSAPTETQIFGQLSFHTYYDPKRSIRTDGHKLIANFSASPRAMDPTQSWNHRSTPAVLQGRSTGASQPLELYDLVADPLERHDLSRDPGAASELRVLAAALLGWMEQQQDPLLVPSAVDPRHDLSLALLRQAAAAQYGSGRTGAPPYDHPATTRTVPAGTSREQDNS